MFGRSFCLLWRCLRFFCGCFCPRFAARLNFGFCLSFLSCFGRFIVFILLRLVSFFSTHFGIVQGSRICTVCIFLASGFCSRSDFYFCFAACFISTSFIMNRTIFPGHGFFTTRILCTDRRFPTGCVFFTNRRFLTGCIFFADCRFFTGNHFFASRRFLTDCVFCASRRFFTACAVGASCCFFACTVLTSLRRCRRLPGQVLLILLMIFAKCLLPRLYEDFSGIDCDLPAFLPDNLYAGSEVFFPAVHIHKHQFFLTGKLVIFRISISGNTDEYTQFRSFGIGVSLVFNAVCNFKKPSSGK